MSQDTKPDPDDVMITLPTAKKKRELLARLLCRVWYRATDDGLPYRIVIRKKGARDEARYCATFLEAVETLFRETPGCEEFEVKAKESA